MQNNQIEAFIVPDIGRMVHFGKTGGQNLLRIDDGLKGKIFTDTADSEWPNYGGHWLWPAAQSVWPDFQTNNWPPSAAIDRQAWIGHAWQDADGSLSCSISRKFGAPLNIKVKQTYKLAPTDNFIYIRQSIQRTAAADIPVTLWNIVQVADPASILLKTENEEFRTMMFDAPDSNSIVRCNGMIVYTPAQNEETKLCSGAPEAQTAAILQNSAILLETINPSSEGTFPDNGCSTEIYVNSGMGYAELETLSIEKALQENETMSSSIRICLIDLDPGSTNACTLAEQITAFEK